MNIISILDAMAAATCVKAAKKSKNKVESAALRVVGAICFLEFLNEKDR